MPRFSRCMGFSRYMRLFHGRVEQPQVGVFVAGGASGDALWVEDGELFGLGEVFPAAWGGFFTPGSESGGRLLHAVLCHISGGAAGAPTIILAKARIHGLRLRRRLRGGALGPRLREGDGESG